MNSDLYDFVREALGKGASRAQIGEALIGAGWSQAEVAAAINGFADIAFPIPVPRPRPYLSAREVFIYGLQFSALYVSVYALGGLFFDFIDLAFPDALATNAYNFATDWIRWHVSLLIVAFPLFLWMHTYTNRLIIQDPTRRASKPRKWLTYLTMLISASGLICDVGSLVYYILSGDLTTPLLLKIITIGVLAGGIFAYFLADQRQDETGS